MAKANRTEENRKLRRIVINDYLGILLHWLLDLFILEYIIFMRPASEGLYYAMMSVWAVKLMLPAISFGLTVNIIGTAACAAEIVMSIIGVHSIFIYVLLGVSLLLHLIRFGRLEDIKELKKRKGYPKFLSDDTSSGKKLSDKQQRKLERKRSAEEDSGRIAKAVKRVYDKKRYALWAVGAAALIAVQVLVVPVTGWDRRLSSYELKTLDNVVSGDYVTGTIDRIYARFYRNGDPSTDPVYFVNISGNCIAIVVPTELEDRFVQMRRYYSKANEDAPEGAKILSPGEDIHFTGILFDRNTKEREHFSLDFKTLQQEAGDLWSSLNKIQAYWIEITDVD
ncbi:MAG: hypothetical protein IJ561_00010 [Ruminococcus sp.]|nr:hypothetical protein [Ruminococcus sp.]